MEPQTRFWGFHFHQTAVSPKFFPHLSHLSSFLNATNSNISAFIAIWKLSSTTLMGDANFKTSPSSFFWRSRTWDFEFLDLLLGQLQDLHPTQFQPSACALDKVDAHLWNHLRGWTMQIGRSTCEKLGNHYGKIYCFKKKVQIFEICSYCNSYFSLRCFAHAPANHLAFPAKPGRQIAQLALLQCKGRLHHCHRHAGLNCLRKSGSQLVQLGNVDGFTMLKEPKN